MAEDEAYRHRLLHEDDVAEDPDFPMITSPFLHHHDGNDNGHGQYANGERSQWRGSRARSRWQRRISSGRFFGSVRLFPCELTARTGVILGLLMLLLVFAFWPTKSPGSPPVVEDSIFKVSFPQFQAKNGTNPFAVGGVRI